MFGDLHKRLIGGAQPHCTSLLSRMSLSVLVLTRIGLFALFKFVISDTSVLLNMFEALCFSLWFFSLLVFYDSSDFIVKVLDYCR